MMGRCMKIAGSTLLMVGSCGFWIVLLASPVFGAIWADSNMWVPWDYEAKWRWLQGLATAVMESWRYVAAMGVCLLLAIAGGLLRRVAEARQIQVGSVAR